MKTRPTETTRRCVPRPLLVAALVFLVAAVAAATLIWRLEQYRLQEERARVSSLAGDHASDLQRRLDRAFSATYALAALVRQGHGGITDFDAVARQMLPFYPGAVALQLAPGGVIRQSVPLEGNEKAIGHDLLKDPTRDKEARLARDTGKLTLAGPFDLVQGGVGAVARLPVFLDDKQGNPAFWGFTTELIRFPEMLDQAPLSKLTGRGFVYELWRINPVTGKKQVIAAAASFPLAAAVERPIQVPNGAWTLSMAPIKGWGDPVALALNVALGLLFSLLLAWLAKLLVDSKAHETGLEVLVAERTAEIRESEERLRLLGDNLPDSYVYQYLHETDGTPHYLHLSAGVERLHGVSRQDVLYDAGTLHRQIDPEQLPAMAAAEAASLREMTDVQMEVRMQRADGEWRWLQVRSCPRRKPDGQILWDGVATDITEKKRAEDELKKSEAEFRRLSQEFNGLLDAIPDSLMLLDRELNVLWANRAAAQSIGSEAEVLAGRDCYALWYDRTTPCEPCPVLQCFESGAPNDESVTRPDGRTWDIRTVPLMDEQGKVAKVIEVKRDITEHKKLEKQYLHAQKMESIGTLAGGVAHDFNNILTVIVGLGHITLMKMAEDDPHRRNIGGILEAAKRAAHLTRELLLFSRKQESERRPVDLNDTIGKMENFLHRIIGEDISLKQAPHGAPLPVLADCNHLEQVLMNLAVNARDAMPHGGEFTLRTEQVELDEEFATAHGYGKPGSYALLSVSDTGMGMDKETLQRIFEPFYTTKEVGKGTGLGLSVVYGIIKQHDGFITVYSEPGQGSTFRIYLPLTTATARQETSEHREEIISRGTETILLAEDNEPVRELVTSVLTDAGYSVIVAVDGKDAVRKFRESADAIQLLLFDLVMPRMSGREASDEIRTMQPGLKTIFASGNAPDIAQQKATFEDGCYLIYKPVSPHELLKKVRSVLDGTL